MHLRRLRWCLTSITGLFSETNDLEQLSREVLKEELRKIVSQMGRKEDLGQTVEFAFKVEAVWNNKQKSFQEKESMLWSMILQFWKDNMLISTN